MLMLVETKIGLKGRTDRRYVYNNGHEALLVEREWGYYDRGLELIVYQYNRPYSDEPLTYDYHIGLSEFEAQKILKEVQSLPMLSGLAGALKHWEEYFLANDDDWTDEIANILQKAGEDLGLEGVTMEPEFYHKEEKE